MSIFQPILLICLVSLASSSIFCSSRCADYITACNGSEPENCLACSTTVFQLQKTDISGSCEVKPQHSVYFSELQNSNMSLLDTYTVTSSSTPLLCSVYQISGSYIAGDFIMKTFTSLPTNHYQVVVRFNIAYMGYWSDTDAIYVTIDGVTYTKVYGSCAVQQSICTIYGADCIKIFSQVVTHYAKNITIKVESNITETNTSIKFWAIRDMVISGRECNSMCSTCFGPSSGQCITCNQGYFLWGNLCVEKCVFFSVPAQGLCAEVCPTGYFDNGKQECIACEADCLVCSNVIGCEVWSNKKSGAVWEQNKMFWILLIVVLFLVFLYFFYKLVIKRHLKNKGIDSDINQRMVTDSNLEKAKQKSNDKSGSDGSDQRKDEQQSYHSESKQYFDTKNVIFEEDGLNWAADIPTVEQILVSNTSNAQKRKRKRLRPAGELEQNPATIEMEDSPRKQSPRKQQPL